MIEQQSEEIHKKTRRKISIILFKCGVNSSET